MAVRFVAWIFAAALVTGAAGCGIVARKQEPPLTRFCARMHDQNRARTDEAESALAARIAASNVTVLVSASDGADQLATRAADISRRLAARGRAEYLLPSEADELRVLGFSYLQHTKALGQVVEDHDEFAEMADLSPAARTLGIAARLAAGLIQQDLSMALVAAFDDISLAKAQLNLPLVKEGVPKNLYRHLRDASRSLAARAALRAAIDRFQAAEVQRQILEDQDGGALRRLAKRIYASPAYDELRRDEELGRVVARSGETLVGAAESTVDTMDETWYPVQVFISSLIGDAVTSPRGPRIPADLIERTRHDVVRPGDIILERCDFYLSNVFLPGWWGHSALYVGDRADLERLGLADDAAVKPHLDELAKEHDLLEAVSEGVVVSSLAHVMRADHIAVLRPRYKDDEAVRRAIRLAFGHVGKAYDFKFDFETDDVLVCSELCWRALEGTVDAKLVRRVGRFTLIPDDLAVLAKGKDAQLELISFIKDGKESGRPEFDALVQ